MTRYLCISVRFLDPSDCPSFHGRADRGEPEWPPSPLRLYQAILAVSAARCGHSERFPENVVAAFRWLARLTPPQVIAPTGVPGVGVRTAVPNNDLDVVWPRLGQGLEPDKQPAELKTLKTVRPTYVLGGSEFPAVHYLWEIEPPDQAACEEHKETLFAASSDLVALGWGTDLAAGQGRLLGAAEANELEGERWEPVGDVAGTKLRVPMPDTFDALVARHAAFLHRLGEQGFKPVPPLTTFATVGYRREEDPRRRPFAAFQLLTPDAERKWTRGARWAVEVAGMVRHTTRLAAEAVGQPRAWIDTFVLGHGSGKNQQAVGEEGARRFAYVPLPTIRPPGVIGNVNRVLIVEPPGGTGADAAWARRMLSGRELIDQRSQSPVALLALAPTSEWVIRQYGDEGGSAIWSTVTPVVLPGYDDPDHLRQKLKGTMTPEARRRLYERLDARIDGLLRKAIVQAGFPSALSDRAELSWRLVGFRSGVDLATRYTTPDHLTGKPRYHVRIIWKDAGGSPVKVRGPVVVGAGRYCGLGVFAQEA